MRLSVNFPGGFIWARAHENENKENTSGSKIPKRKSGGSKIQIAKDRSARAWPEELQPLHCVGRHPAEHHFQGEGASLNSIQLQPFRVLLRSTPNNAKWW